jgi:hypothetical protein
LLSAPSLASGLTSGPRALQCNQIALGCKGDGRTLACPAERASRIVFEPPNLYCSRRKISTKSKPCWFLSQNCHPDNSWRSVCKQTSHDLAEKWRCIPAPLAGARPRTAFLDRNLSGAFSRPRFAAGLFTAGPRRRTSRQGTSWSEEFRPNTPSTRSARTNRRSRHTCAGVNGRWLARCHSSNRALCSAGAVDRLARGIGK